MTTASFRSLIGTHKPMLSLFGQLVSVSSSTLAFIYVFLSPKGHDWTLTNQQSDMPGTLGLRASAQPTYTKYRNSIVLGFVSTPVCVPTRSVGTRLNEVNNYSLSSCIFHSYRLALSRSVALALYRCYSLPLQSLLRDLLIKRLFDSHKNRAGAGFHGALVDFPHRD